MAHWLASQAVYEGVACCPGRLLRVNKRYPGLVNGVQRVVGDLYRLRDSSLWARLDEYEGCDGKEGDEYRRVVVSVFPLEGNPVSAWVYQCRRVPEGAEEIASADWLQS